MIYLYHRYKKQKKRDAEARQLQEQQQNQTQSSIEPAGLSAAALPSRADRPSIILREGQTQAKPNNADKIAVAPSAEPSPASTQPTSPEKSTFPDIHPLHPSAQLKQPTGSSGVPHRPKKEQRLYRLRLLLGLSLPYFIASTDVTLVATALPFIASHFTRLSELNWIVTSFTIPSTAFIPVWGQVSDIYGRMFVLETCLGIMMIGAALCAGAQAWSMLLVGRGIMGLGSAGLLNVVKIVLADKVSLKENARNNTIFALVSGVSFGVGPVIGGYLTSVSWRWCFIINVPVCAVAMVVLPLVLRKDLVGPAPIRPELGEYEGEGWLGKGVKRLKTIDYGGLILFVSGTTLLILGTTWGGATYSWRSHHVLVPIIIGGALFALFFVYEALIETKLFKNQEPMIPLRLFKKRDLSLLAWISFSTGSAMYSIFYFVGIYFTVVKALPPDQAGTSLLYYLPGIGVGAYSAMFLANVWPKQTWYPIFIGSILETVGFAVLIYALHIGHMGIIGGMMGLTGAGTGLRLMPETLHVTGIWPNQIARAMSVIDFCIPFGGTISLAMMGAVFNNKLTGFQLPGTHGPIRIDSPHSSSLNAISRLPSDAQAAFRSRASWGVVWSFIAVMPIIALAIVASLFLGNVKITKMEKRSETGHLDTGDAVEKRPFLWALITGPKRSRGVEELPREK